MSIKLSLHYDWYRLLDPILEELGFCVMLSGPVSFVTREMVEACTKTLRVQSLYAWILISGVRAPLSLIPLELMSVVEACL